jgi:hypothetical protein
MEIQQAAEFDLTVSENLASMETGHAETTHEIRCPDQKTHQDAVLPTLAKDWLVDEDAWSRGSI